MRRQKIYPIERHEYSKDYNTMLVELSRDNLERGLHSLNLAVERVTGVDVAPELCKQVSCLCSDIIIKASQLREIISK